VPGGRGEKVGWFSGSQGSKLLHRIFFAQHANA